MYTCVCVSVHTYEHTKTHESQAKKAPAPAVVSDAELCAAIDRLVVAGDLNTLTKRSLREQLQVRFLWHSAVKHTACMFLSGLSPRLRFLW